MNIINKYLTVVLFFAILISFPIVIIISKKQVFSQNENRYLSKLPNFSFSEIYKKKDINDPQDKNYMDKVEEYLCDHFPLRTYLISTKTSFDLLEGRKEINNVFILDDMLLERFNEPDYIKIDRNISYINEFAEKKWAQVYFMLVPTSAGIYRDLLPLNSEVCEQKPFVDAVYKLLNKDNITTINAFETLYSSRDEYIYYRTDHHWTSLGAYYAYADAIKAMGQSPISINKFDVEHASYNFLGTYYSKVLYNDIKPDNVDIYYCNNGTKVKSVDISTGNVTLKHNDIFFREYLSKKDKYSVFTGPNQPLVSIKTDSQSNEKLLLIKDSYAHCMIPFLLEHYKQIDMVDLRYLKDPLNNSLNLNRYNQILFLYNTSNFSTDNSFKMLRFNGE